MVIERKAEVDRRVQEVLDRVVAAHREQPEVGVRTLLARHLAAVGVGISVDNLEAWARAIENGEDLRAEIVFT